MKTLQTVILTIALAAIFVSCQSISGQTQGLSNERTRKVIMDTIASDSIMSREMIGTMMNSNNGMMTQQLMMGNQNSMMKMLKDNPAMMQRMMSAMMETAKSDSTMMSGMIKTMSENTQMMQMLQNMTGNNSMGHMEGISNK
ncbi:hypothetical protein [Chondrinema litorale]|uniref:hypothetical protein n=1 Tax=Chondrinema litorale TaxID=2994555 RepID=UPI0025436A83|nr:hypothetical protein [Chondrinema litorale]UZR99968.1 hypothetical protein OQ292_39455 [Chondrinema litorale]